MSNAISAQGTKFYIADDATSVSPTNYIEVGEVQSFDGPGGQASIIDTTHLGSEAREKLMGLMDEGQISLSVNYVHNDPGQDACKEARRNQEKRAMKLVLPGSVEQLLFEGFVLGFAVSGGVDDKVSANITVEITGPVEFV